MKIKPAKRILKNTSKRQKRGTAPMANAGSSSSKSLENRTIEANLDWWRTICS